MIIDTNLVIDKIRKREIVNESITVVTLIEYPYILEYSGFTGDVIFPTMKDYYLAYEIQKRLMMKDKMKGFADILVAAIAIGNNEKLLTNDKDFIDIAEVSSLKLEVV
jgi:hypothetical protein